MHTLHDVAPEGEVTAYDRLHLLIYAELLDADSLGLNWQQGAQSILGLNPLENGEAVRRCWETHLARARWIVGAGIQTAMEAFAAQCSA